MRRRLLALDLDGTLLRPDGTVDPRDAAAVRHAMNAGVIVTIATGRVAGGTLPTARALGLSAPLVCGDGGVVLDPQTGQRIEQNAISVAGATDVLNAFGRHAMVPFVLMYDVIHCDEAGRAHEEYIRIWSPDVTFHPSLPPATAWQREGDIAFAMGVGTQAGAQSALDEVVAAGGDTLAPVSFRLRRKRDQWAVLVRPSGCTKGAALSRVATRLGVAREDTCVVGDWYNDVPMFEWAARSFAMGQSPEPVRAAATDKLVADHTTGGGVAEAVERWLGAGTAPRRSDGT